MRGAGRCAWLRAAALASVLSTSLGAVSATELVGRVVDAVDSRVFAGATVQARGAANQPTATRTDEQGFFCLPGLPAGSYLIDVELPDGRSFLARLVLLPNRERQFLDLDYSRAVPPDDEDY